MICMNVRIELMSFRMDGWLGFENWGRRRKSTGTGKTTYMDVILYSFLFDMFHIKLEKERYERYEAIEL
ncbi:hypothetical protein HanXRQr2_Chr10g0441511 [Helianthus annuus]|uniref:P-loop containing nucleoside triphosphate hydrolase n=1 Tax=Helianthus annuus TaxID=4232 RepID=A0A9K3N4C5_HELAN|nr:hypothetical protein HanXRQr2_Chr10g0441511 [Helianthus annuus]